MGEVDDLRLAVGALAAIGLAFGLSQPQVLGPSVVVGLVLLLAFYLALLASRRRSVSPPGPPGPSAGPDR